MKTKMHNGSRLLSLLLAVVLVLTLTVPALAAEKPQDMNLKIAVMSDDHYLSPSMIRDTEDYKTALNSDRKMFAESDAILRTLLDAVRQDKPDVLLLSGDLTKDGEQECHKALAKQLKQLQKEVPGMKVYVINGNHDIRNSDALNFNTPDGKAVPATRTHPKDFKQIYDFVYSDPTVIATYTPPAGKEAGGLSYVARPADGFTLVVIDTGRYSSDNTSTGKDEHETSGAISSDLEQWVIAQIQAAKARGDVVLGMQHHGLVAHFDVEPTILPMYLVNNYDRLAQEYADAGMSVMFTGHMHAVDIAAKTTDAGNTIYDIETGSAALRGGPPQRGRDGRLHRHAHAFRPHQLYGSSDRLGQDDRRPHGVRPRARLLDRYAQDGRGQLYQVVFQQVPAGEYVAGHEDRGEHRPDH